jgi:hypothetical protein
MKRRVLALVQRRGPSCRYCSGHHWWHRPLVLDVAAALLCIAVTVTLSYFLGWM